MKNKKELFTGFILALLFTLLIGAVTSFPKREMNQNLPNVFQELKTQRTQFSKSYYNPALDKYRFESAFHVYKERIFPETNWIDPSEYPARFILRLKDGTIKSFNKIKLLDYLDTISNTSIWGLGIENFQGALGFYFNYNDANCYSQMIYYPRLNSGKLSNWNNPQYFIYPHFFVQLANLTWRDYFPLARDQTIVNQLQVNENSTTLEIYYERIGISLYGRTFDFRNGIKLDLVSGLFKPINWFRCRDQSFPNCGYAYEIENTAFVSGTDLEASYIYAFNATHGKLAQINQIWDMDAYLLDWYSQIHLYDKARNAFIFDFGDMELTGFNQKYLDIHSQQMMDGYMKQILRVGMYNLSLAQNQIYKIDPTFASKQTNANWDFNIVNDETVEDLAFLRFGYYPTDIERRAFISWNTTITEQISTIENVTFTFWCNNESVDPIGEWGEWSNELLTNGGFEWDNFTGWDIVQGNWDTGTDPKFGNKGAQSGSYCAFITSDAVAGDNVTQYVNLTAYASEIDAGNMVTNVSAWGVSAEDTYDEYRVHALFLNSTMQNISTIFDSTLTTDTVWTNYNVTNTSIPATARYIQVTGEVLELGWDCGSVDTFSVVIRGKEDKEAQAWGLYQKINDADGIWNLSEAQGNPSDAYNQTTYWNDSAFHSFDGEIGTNSTITASKAETIMNQWLSWHNTNPANRSMIPIKLYSGIGMDSNTDDFVNISSSQDTNVSRRPTLTFDYTLVVPTTTPTITTTTTVTTTITTATTEEPVTTEIEGERNIFGFMNDIMRDYLVYFVIGVVLILLVWIGWSWLGND